MEVVPAVGKIRPQLILAALGLLALLATGQAMRVAASRIGMTVVGLTVWFIACVPFGAWPGGSVQIFLDQWYKAALIYMLAAGLLTTLPQANKVWRAIAYATGLLGLIVLLKNNHTVDGRMVLDNTRYANSNALAWTLLVGLTFIGFLFVRGNRMQKIIAVLLAPPVLLVISRTGSRMGALGAIILFFMMVRQAKRSTRVRLLVVAPLAFFAVIALMPKNTLLRYATFFGDYNTYDRSSAEQVRVSTIESTEARTRLLKDSLIITAKHPILGVGPGNFMVAQNEMALARGERAEWRITHNTYTQLSSEMGLPGLGIYLAMLYFVFQTLNSIIRNKTRTPSWENLRALALSLRTAFIIFLPIAFFDALAYNADIPIIAGLATAVGFMAEKQRAVDRMIAAQTKVEALTPADTQLEPALAGQY